MIGEKSNLKNCIFSNAFLLTQTVYNLPAMQETQVQSWTQKDPLKKATHSCILAWEIPW